MMTLYAAVYSSTRRGCWGLLLAVIDARWWNEFIRCQRVKLHVPTFTIFPSPPQTTSMIVMDMGGRKLHEMRSLVAAWTHLSKSDRSVTFIISVFMASGFIMSRPGFLSPRIGQYKSGITTSFQCWTILCLWWSCVSSYLLHFYVKSFL